MLIRKSAGVSFRFAAMCLIFIALCMRPVQADTGQGEIVGHIEKLLPEKAEWALVVIDMETGENVAAFGNSLGERLVPASLVKLLTTGAVFDYVEHGGTVRKTVTVKAKKNRKGKRKGRSTIHKVVEIRDREQLIGMLRDMNVHSRNHTAQNLADLLGEERFGAPVTRQKGSRALRAFLKTLDLPAGESHIADGSGLTRENRVTARFMARYLYEVAKKPWFCTFRETLPRPGFEGTVKKIGYTDQRFRVKTGRLNDVFALAGYGVDPGGRDFSFAFIVNVKNSIVYDRNHSRGEVMRLLAEGSLQQAAPVSQ